MSRDRPRRGRDRTHEPEPPAHKPARRFAHVAQEYAAESLRDGYNYGGELTFRLSGWARRSLGVR